MEQPKPAAKVHRSTSKRTNDTTWMEKSSSTLNIEPSIRLLENVKKLKSWFSLWRQWQRRIAICRLLEQCSLGQLECLATSLEPVLHLDFANSLSPLNAALHQEGSQTFYIQRAFCQVPDKELVLGRDLAPFSLFKPEPANLQTTKEYEMTKVDTSGVGRVFIPGLPVIHSEHNVTLPSGTDQWQPTQGEADMFPLQRKLNSVPDIRSTTALLQKTRHDWKHVAGIPRRNKHVAQLGRKKEKQRHAEEYKKQLALMARVSGEKGERLE